MPNEIGITTANLITSEQLIDIVTASAERLMHDPEACNVVPSIMLRGAPGVGKSTIIRMIADKLKIGFRDVRLSQMDRCDLAGLPDIDKVKHVTTWNIPAFWPDGNVEPNGIILLDEITSAPADVQVAAYSIVLDRAIPNSHYKLPSGWLIVAAGNRAQDRAVVKTMSSALANRFVHYEVEANVPDWTKWAVVRGIHPSVVGFINARPNLLFNMDSNQALDQGWPSPRSWERVSTMVEMFGNREEILRKNVHGLVGPGAATEFMAFHELQKKYDDVRAIMLDPNATINIPRKPDEKYAVAASAVYHLWTGKNEAETKKLVDGFFRIVLAIDTEYGAMMAKSSMLGNAHVSKADAARILLSAKQINDVRKKYNNVFSMQQEGLTLDV